MSGLWPQIRAELNGEFWVPHMLYTVNGTGVDMWTGFPADCARALEQVNDGLYLWQPVGYPGAMYPMDTSVNAGVAELIRLINLRLGTFALIGYSQGAMVTSIVWRDHILNPEGQLHHRLGDVIAHVTFGNPLRSPGIAKGNDYAGLPVPKHEDGATTGGIAGPDDLTPDQVPDWMLDFAHDGDLYASAPVGDDPWHNESRVGGFETAIYNIIQEKYLGQSTIVPEVLQLLGNIPANFIPMAEAIINGLVFVAEGTRPHINYDIAPAVDFLNKRGTQITARDV